MKQSHIKAKQYNAINVTPPPGQVLQALKPNETELSVSLISFGFWVSPNKDLNMKYDIMTPCKLCGTISIKINSRSITL